MGDAGVHGRQILQRPLQLFPIVPAGAHHDLAHDLESGLSKPPEVFQALPAPGIAQHPAAKIRIGGVNGHIQRGNVHGDDPLYIGLAQIGHGDIIAHEKGETGVIVFEIQRRTHPFGQLVNKAKDAFVGTAALLVHEIGLKIQPQRFPFGLSDGKGLFLPVLLLAQGQLQATVIGIKLVIQHIADGMAVDLLQPPSSGDPGFLSRTVLIHMHNLSRHRPFLLFGKHLVKNIHITKNREGGVPSLSFMRVLFADLDFEDLTAFICAAASACSVGHDQFAALGALDHTGNFQLPVGTTPLVSSLFRDFTLRDRHR